MHLYAYFFVIPKYRWANFPLKSNSPIDFNCTIFYDVPGGEVWWNPPPMTVTCPGLKGVESVENAPNICFIGLLTVCLYIFLLPRLRINLGYCLCPYSHNIYTYYLVRYLWAALLSPKNTIFCCIILRKRRQALAVGIGNLTLGTGHL